MKGLSVSLAPLSLLCVVLNAFLCQLEMGRL